MTNPDIVETQILRKKVLSRPQHQNSLIEMYMQREYLLSMMRAVVDSEDIIQARVMAKIALEDWRTIKKNPRNRRPNE